MIQNILNKRIFLASTLGNDPHTEGVLNAGKIAQKDNIQFIFVPPSNSYDDLLKAIKKYQPHFLGLSYRLTPQIGFEELKKFLYLLYNTSALDNNAKICFAGLPATIELVKSKIKDLPQNIHVVEPYTEVIDQINQTVDFFEIKANRNSIVTELKKELIPHRIKLLDELADEIIFKDEYKMELPLPIPSEKAKSNYIQRISESQIPLLRTHFGIPSDDIYPTVEGIKKISEARVIDEISLGSSDLSQRYFGFPEIFKLHKNDGGVPYKTADDLVKMYEATRRGNFPGIKPYAHVTDMENFVDVCLKTGMIKGAHQAVPLYWFNELDRRGPNTVKDSINEHIRTVKKLALKGVPVEMNDPNQWSSRWAHDTIITASYGLISAVMLMCDVKDMVLQMQFNKPKETGDFADIAKMQAALIIAKQITSGTKKSNIFVETRTGIESLSADMNKAKWQLGRSTLLQMCLSPSIIHLVSYCEANYAALPEDIIDSSKLIRKAIKLFKDNEGDIRKEVNNEIIHSRRDYLVEETSFLLQSIAKFHPKYKKSLIYELAPYLADPEVLYKAIRNKVITAPGIIIEKYKADFVTKPMKYGMINMVDGDYIISEKERLKKVNML